MILEPKESSSASVKNYLKNMTRKSSIEKLVEWSRENYGKDLQKQPVQEDALISGERKCTVTPKNLKNKSLTSGIEELATVTSTQSYELKLRM